MKSFKLFQLFFFCLTIGHVQAQLPPNYLGLSADSISHLAKTQNYKLRATRIINHSEFEVEYFTDFDGKVGKNSIGNSMLRCIYIFSIYKEKNNCIECKYGFIESGDMTHMKKLLNKSSQFIKDGTFRTKWGWDSIDDKSYVFLDEPDYRRVYEFHYRKRLDSDVVVQLPPNYLGLSVDSINNLAKKQNYKFLGDSYITYGINDVRYEVEYETDFDWKVRRNSIGNSMWRCTYLFSKDKSHCIECSYSFHIIEDVDYCTKLLNNDPNYIKGGTYRTSGGWDNIDDKSYAYIQNETDMGERFNVVYRLRLP